jgi:hypothetical protein
MTGMTYPYGGYKRALTGLQNLHIIVIKANVLRIIDYSLFNFSIALGRKVKLL